MSHEADNPLYGMQSERGAWETQGTVSKDEPLCILEEPNRFFKFVYTTYTNFRRGWDLEGSGDFSVEWDGGRGGRNTEKMSIGEIPYKKYL